MWCAGGTQLAICVTENLVECSRLFGHQVDKAKEMMRESVIKGTTRVPGKQLVIIISRAKEEGTSSQSEVPGSGDPSTSSASAGKTSEDAQEKAKQKPEAGRPDEEKNGERSPKVARMDEKADDT